MSLLPLLAGKKIVITRPRLQSKNFSQKLINLGAEIINFPTIEIIPTGNSALDSALEKLDNYDWIIFTSVNGLEIFFKRFSEKKLNLKDFHSLKFAVIGSKTSETLNNYNIKADLIPDEFVGESLVSKFAEIDIMGKRFLIPGAALSREILPEKLVEYGAIVDNIAIYETVLPDSAGVEFIINRLFNENIDYITFTSSSTVNNFFEILQNYPLEKLVSQTKVVCIGPVTAKTVTEKLNIQPIIAEIYTVDGIIETIINDIKK